MKNQELLRKEHEAIRNNVGFFDFTHETLEVTGKDAKDFLDYVCVNDVENMKKGDALYTTILKEDANTVDDVIVFYYGEDKYWITTALMKELSKWLKDHVGDKDVNFKDITANTALYAVQGPRSKDVLNDILEDSVDDLGYFQFKETKVDDIYVMASRTGFTGELGYELHFDPKYTDKIVDKLKEKGKSYDLEEITTDVIVSSLPTEKGYITSADFLGANPVELGLEWSVDCEKDFIGKQKLCVLKEEGPKRNLLGFKVGDKDAKIEKGNKVKLNGETIGEVTKYTYGYTVDEYIGYALVDSKANKGDKVVIVTSDGEVEVTLQERMFYDPKGERVRG
ncbi:aminomethyltransferase family protein [Tissierella creatinophila]|uniref:Aminomethyltransferase n=1 Tax=Tissierella creatinophila DSM 6911 TaxID=1123403 RepID=A0A1U7M5A0_TISCR|nr:aminomethyltransferase family protein [Tissierella creatinophila]OLS02368.1 aminomethyltransferase [Tissierella creatinophila DSM 6911]